MKKNIYAYTPKQIIEDILLSMQKILINLLITNLLKTKYKNFVLKELTEPMGSFSLDIPLSIEDKEWILELTSLEV